MATAETEINQLILNKEEKAPYHGILVSDMFYKKMYADIFMKDALATNLNQCYKENIEKEYSFATNKYLWAFGGLLMGFGLAQLNK